MVQHATLVWSVARWKLSDVFVFCAREGKALASVSALESVLGPEAQSFIMARLDGDC